MSKANLSESRIRRVPMGAERLLNDRQCGEYCSVSEPFEICHFPQPQIACGLWQMSRCLRHYFTSVGQHIFTHGLLKTAMVNLLSRKKNDDLTYKVYGSSYVFYFKNQIHWRIELFRFVHMNPLAFKLLCRHAQMHQRWTESHSCFIHIKLT